MHMDVLAQHWCAFANTPWAFVVLFVHSFLESCILPGAHYFFLIAVAIAQPKLSFYYAIFSTVGSLAGGSFGYGVGRAGGRPVLAKLFGAKWVDVAEIFFRKYDTWAIAVAVCTPFPYKIFSVAAGIFGMNFAVYLTVSIIIRTMRFFLIAGFIYYCGPQVKEMLLASFNTWLYGIMAAFLAVFIVWKMAHSRKKQKEP